MDKSTPTDLGVLGLTETKLALDRLKGPGVLKGSIAKDDFSQLTHEEKVQVSFEARKRVSDRFVVLKLMASLLIKVIFAKRLLSFIAEKLLGEKVGKHLTWAVILVLIYRKLGAPKPLGTTYKGPKLYPFFGGLLGIMAQKNETHEYLLTTTVNAGFETTEIPVPSGCFVQLMDARDREYVLKTNPWNFLKNRPDDHAGFEYVFEEVLGRGIFSTDKSEWLESRKIASHMFTGHALKTQMELVFNKHADKVVELLTDNIVMAKKKQTVFVVDMQEVFQCAVFDAFCEIAFGVFPNALHSAIEGKKPDFLLSFDFLQNQCSQRVALPPPVWHMERLFGIFTGLGNEGLFIEHSKLVNDYVNKIIEERLNESDLVEKNDLLSLYIQYSRSQSEPFEIQDFRDIILNFMIAGRDTTSCTLTYSIKLLGEHPLIVQKLKEEGLFEFGKTNPNNNLITFDESKSLPYVDAVVNEVLRMYPPVGDDFRICVSDDVLPSGLKIRDGTRMVIPNVAIGRDPFLWSNPLEMKPERWLKYNAEGIAEPVKRVDEFVHPVFFAGRRLCLGKDMARFEAIVFISKIFSKLKVTPLKNQDSKMVVGPVIFLKHGIKCELDVI